MPDWIQVDFAGSKTIDEINVFSLHDNYTQENAPTETQTFSLYGLLAFNVQYWNGSSWVTIPGGSVTGNNKVWRKFTFSPITTSKIRVFINTVPDAWSRVVEIQAFGTSAGGDKVRWLVPDHLGTPRIVVDETGSLAGIKRHDYLPFGEELLAGTGGRTVAMGYAGDGVRQQYTAQERDFETGLDYFRARYYLSTQGRFISPDPLLASGITGTPQSWNRYTYCINNPVRFVDPNGLIWGSKRDGTTTTYQWFDSDKVGEGFKEVTEHYVEGMMDGKLVGLTLNPQGPYSFWKWALISSTNLSLIYSHDDFFVQGYKVGPTKTQLSEYSRTGAVDMMPNQAFDVGLLVGGLRRPLTSGTNKSGLPLDGKAYELNFLKKHLPGTTEAGREIARDGSAHVFNDLATLSRVEAEIFSRGMNTGYTRNWFRIGLKFDEQIGTRIAADGTKTALHYGEMKLRSNGLYHIVPRTGPSQ